MDAVRQWVLSMCSVAVLGAAVNILSGGGKYDKALRFAVAALAVCAVAAPFSGISSCDRSYCPDNDAYLSAYSGQLEQRISEQMMSAVTGALETAVTDELELLGVSDALVEVQAHYDGGSVTVSEITVYVDSRYISQSGDIEDRLYSRLGIRARVSPR